MNFFFFFPERKSSTYILLDPNNNNNNKNPLFYDLGLPFDAIFVQTASSKV